MKYVLLISVLASSVLFFSCKDNPVNIIQDIISNKVTAKDRLDSANAQATRKYGSNSKLILVLGQNVIYSGTDRGRTDITITSAISDPNNIGAWLYIFKRPGTDTLAIYTPDPTPGQRNCIELTKYFSTGTIIGLIPDTSAKNIISSALSFITNTSFQITTSSANLVDSDVGFDYANSISPVLKFNSSFIPSNSTLNGNTFFGQDTSGTTRTVNMFLIPTGLGALNLPNFITGLIGFPADMWIINYKKSISTNTQNLVLGTVTQSSQIMGIPVFGLSSKVINISKYVTGK